MADEYEFLSSKLQESKKLVERVMRMIFPECFRTHTFLEWKSSGEVMNIE